MCRSCISAHRVTVSFQLSTTTTKRLRAYQEIRHVDGWLAATSRIAVAACRHERPAGGPFPARDLARIDALAEAHGGLPLPERAGRAIGIKRKPG